MLRSLIDWAKRQEKRPVLFYNGDHDLLLVSRNRDDLAEWFDFVVGEESLVEQLVDKERFGELARRLDLPVPPHGSFDPKTTEPGDVDLGFPLVIKPVTHRRELWHPIAGPKKALLVEDAGGLETVWPKLREQGRVIAQRLIPGGEQQIESYHVYIDETHELVCEFTGRKIRTTPPEFGETTALEITDEDDVKKLGRELSGRIQLTGVAKFDFKRDPQGKLWLLEVNPRFNLWHHAAAVAGANVPAAVYSRLTGRPPAACRTRSGVTWCHPTQDLRVARRAGIPFMRWARFAWNCEAKWSLSTRDPMPFVRGVLLRRLAAKVRR
jgi:predicted ATP-grasp superfamily ATP-dependent carboligase